MDLKSNIKKFTLEKMTDKLGKILDTYVQIQQNVELKLPEIKKL